MHQNSWLFATLLSLLLIHPCVSQTELELDRLIQLPAEEVFNQVHQRGNPARGAILFHGPLLGCGRCHSVTGSTVPLIGPDLCLPRPQETEQQLLVSILDPSAVIAPEFVGTQIITVDSQIVTGLVDRDRASAEQVVLKDVQTLQLIRLPREDIAEQKTSPTSLMPAGILKNFSSTQEFLDLLSYVVEIKQGGSPRAAALQPSAAQLAIQLPEYEQHVDHRGMITSWDQDSQKRGEKIYDSLCVNCHGTVKKVGSLLTALRFAEGKFKNGPDPFSMYQTLTHGAGLMTPQPWMVPRQKYDVIHYIRENYVKLQNPSQYTVVDEAYLSSLPPGDTFGPEPQPYEPWKKSDYGPRMTGTLEIGKGAQNIAQKSISIQLDQNIGGVASGQAWVSFDHDTLRVAGMWTSQGFIDWQGINFNGRHGVHPHIVGNLMLQNPTGPGWRDPRTGSLKDDQRVLGRDGRQYGPLPRDWAQFRGIFQSGRRTVIHYTVANTDIHEYFSWNSAKSSDPSSRGCFTRTLYLSPRESVLEVVVAESPVVAESSGDSGNWRFNQNTATANEDLAISVHADGRMLSDCFATTGNQLRLRIPPEAQVIQLISYSAQEYSQAPGPDPILPLATATAPEAPLFPINVDGDIRVGSDQGGFAVDELVVPKINPWNARIRLTGLDFFEDGDRLAVCTWDGDVWVVSGLSQLGDNALKPRLQWRRVAFGLYQPLGIRILDGLIHLTCRDQLVRLIDRNGDGEIDEYECLNNDHQVTEHFHEFAMGLQTDAAGNFYYAKSARHALPALVPHHGTLLRITADGQETEILANGFRAANGVCLNADGSFIVTDQEGHWNPKNRINWVRRDGFYGNMFGYHDIVDSSDSAMEQPLCWITNRFDRSPAELLWVDSDLWGPLKGQLLNFSYGYGRAYVVPHEFVNISGVDGTLTTQVQGGMCAFPLTDLPTGIIRGRFSPHDHQLYICGLSAWATSQIAEEGGLYRLRYTGSPCLMPIGLHAYQDHLVVDFSDAIAPEFEKLEAPIQIRVWDLKRSANYGSDHYNEHALSIKGWRRSADGKRLTIDIEDLNPTWCMEIKLQLIDASGRPVERVIHNTIHGFN
ncbi:MAG: c-type cytochrome [Planctomycetales bacterium]|nr:c-type cytochrome [Planctomycetales bacterium]